MSSLYPSLEDMKVHVCQQAQLNAFEQMHFGRRVSEDQQSSNGASATATVSPAMAIESSALAAVYPSLMEDYMGLQLEPPSGPIVPRPAQPVAPISYPNTMVLPSAGGQMMIAPVTGNDLGYRRAQVSHGVRQVITCKDANGKVGLRLKSISKGVFVQLVAVSSPAALAGIRFGDQLLQINGIDLAGMSGEKAMELLKKANAQRIELAVRDRPFERIITLQKDSTGHVGFQHRDGKITAIAKNTSAARNGLLIDHNILEVNGQNSIGLKDKEFNELFAKVPQTVTITIMPSYLYDHMMKQMSDGLIKKVMDHSIPEVF